MKTTHKIWMLAAAMCLTSAMALTSCSDDDTIDKSPLAPTTITEGTEKSVSSLTFQWNKVEGAVQYAYELRDDLGSLILGDVTTGNSLLAVSLKANTTYTLSVWAYAALEGDKTTSPIATLTATTNDYTPIIMSTPSVEEENNVITITWPAVDNAEWYTYTITNSEGNVIQQEDNMTDTSVKLTSLEDGNYTMTITAGSSDENFSTSAPVTFDFTFVKRVIETWTGTGNMSTPDGRSYTATIALQADGSYLIPAFNGTEGADLIFRPNAEGGIDILNHYSIDDSGYFYVAGGNGSCAKAYTYAGCSSFSLTETGGEVRFFAYLYDGDSNYLGGDDYYLTWTKDAGPSIDQICGEWTETTSCQDWTVDWANWTKVDNKQTTVTITKIDDTHVNIYNFYGWEGNMTATVNLDEDYILIEPLTDWTGYYGFSATSSESDPVVGRINDDGSITFDDWTAWYGGQLIYYANTLMVKK